MPFVTDMLIMRHDHYLSTEMEGKQPTKIHECPPIYTFPNYLTKIDRGQRIEERGRNTSSLLR